VFIENKFEIKITTVKIEIFIIKTFYKFVDKMKIHVTYKCL